MSDMQAEQRAAQQEAEINRLTSVLNDNEEQMEADRTDAARVALEEAAQLCFYERDKANNTEPSTNGSTMNLDHLMGQGWMANLLGKKLQKLASVLRQPEVGPHKDEDGHCAVCGLKWPDERETLEPHECPPGFRAAPPSDTEYQNTWNTKDHARHLIDKQIPEWTKKGTQAAHDEALRLEGMEIAAKLLEDDDWLAPPRHLRAEIARRTEWKAK